MNTSLEKKNRKRGKQMSYLEQRYSDHGVDTGEQKQNQEGVSNREDRRCHCET